MIGRKHHNWQHKTFISESARLMIKVFVFERYEYESITGRDDTADLTIKYKLYRCKVCGSFQRERE